MFKKGQSGNPSGRPKVIQELQALAREHSAHAFNRIIALVDHEDARVALAASQEILNRGFGKPPQAVVGDGGEGPVRHILEVVWVGRESKEPE
jgi:hypothetical protein